MKYRLYAVGLALLPVAYVSLMLLTGQPIEWSVLGLMALIVLPILVLRKRIAAAERQADAMTDEEKARAIARTAARVARRAVGAD